MYIKRTLQCRKCLLLTYMRSVTNTNMVQETEIINILLLGETGVGKSTAINAIANYLTPNDLLEASNDNLIYLVPAKFSLFDNTLNEKVIVIGESPSESTDPGVSSTRNVQSYILKYKSATIRLIDTPGIGDTRGMTYDEENTEKLLTFIGELNHLNAVCILVKPNNSRFSVLFNYCLKHILLRLNKNIQTNIVFLFTNARSSFYTPGDTYLPLKTMLDEINGKKFKIPFNKSNIFCIDNESFRYLAAKSKGFTFDEDDVDEFKKSWNKSAETVKRMIDYVLSLAPAPMQGIVSINESRRLIGRLGKTIIQMLTLYEKAINTLSNHEANLRASEDTFDDLQHKLYIPVTHYQITEKSWSNRYNSGGFKGGLNVSKSYPFISLDLGYEHTWTDARYTEITIVPYVTKVQDVGLREAIKSKAEALKVMQKIITDMNTLKLEYKNENEVTLNAAVKFTMFLKGNALLNTQDVFENYLGRLMREESTNDGDEKLIENLENLIVKYRTIKNSTSNVNSDEIENARLQLLNLKYSGRNFKELLEKRFDFGDKVLTERKK